MRTLYIIVGAFALFLAPFSVKSQSDQSDEEQKISLQAAPSEASKAAPSEASKAAPSEASKAAPSEASKAVPVGTSRAAVAKSTSVIARALNFRQVRLATLGEAADQLQKLKQCGGQPDADIKEVYQGSKGNRKAYLATVVGETSGTRIIMGDDCSSMISIDPMSAIILSYIAQDAGRFGRRTAVETLFPNGSSNETGLGGRINLSYPTAAGAVIIRSESTNTVIARVQGAGGQVIYEANYELAR